MSPTLKNSILPLKIKTSVFSYKTKLLVFIFQAVIPQKTLAFIVNSTEGREFGG